MKIVCFGGGNALPKTLLPGLKKCSADITTVTSMVDNGGSSGKLRKDFNVLPPGDIRKHLIALSEAPSWKKELFGFRFGHENFGEGHKSHSFGNVFIAGLEYNLKDYEKVLDIAHQFLEVKGKCLPATIEKTQLFAVLENNKSIEGEDEIDISKTHDANLKIKKIFLKPEVQAYSPVLDALKQADLIAIGPGDLYSSLLPCFLPQRMSKALKETKAKKIFICPPMTKFGETNNFSVLNFANETEKHIGCKLDFVLYNSVLPSKERIKKYKEEEPHIYKVVTINENLAEEKFIGENLLTESGPIVYEPDKLVEVILSLVNKH